MDRDLELKIRADARHFYRELEAKVRQFQPGHFIPSIVQKMRRYLDAQRYVRAPQFRIGMAIEANCAYHRGHASQQLTPYRYAQILNVFLEYQQPSLSDLIKKDLGMFFHFLHREQLELQRSYSKPDLSRHQSIFLHADMPRLSSEMIERYGFTPLQWFKAAFAVFATTEGNDTGCLTLSVGTEYREIGLCKEDLLAYLAHSSSTPREIGERFKSLRENTKPQFHACIRSVFVEKPIIDFGEGRYLSPFPAVALQHAGMGLYSLLSTLPSFSIEFGPAFERHVQRVLQHIPYVQRILNHNDLDTMIEGRVCDLLLDCGDYVILVECKATTFTRNIITPETIPDDNSTIKVSEALVQLSNTARRIRNGDLDSIGIARDCKIESLVAVFGEIPFANAPWYYDRFLRSAAELQLGTPLSESLQDAPIVLASPSLEYLVLAMHHQEANFSELRAHKKESGYGATGDWDTYLHERAKGGDLDAALPCVNDDFEEFFASFGIKRGKDASWIHPSPAS